METVQEECKSSQLVRQTGEEKMTNKNANKNIRLVKESDLSELGKVLADLTKLHNELTLERAWLIAAVGVEAFAERYDNWHWKWDAIIEKKLAASLGCSTMRELTDKLGLLTTSMYNMKHTTEGAREFAILDVDGDKNNHVSRTESLLKSLEKEAVESN